MAKAPRSGDAWTVLPHGPIEQLEPNLWRVEGSLPNMPLKRVMAIARRGDGELVIYNPIALEAAELAQLEALGRPAWLVVPNGWHRLDSKAFATRYPDARVIAPAGALKKVASVVDTVRDLAEFPAAAERDVELAVMDGMRGMEAVMTVRSGPRVSVVVGDAVFNMPHLPGVQGWVLRRVTQSSGGPRISRVARWFMVKDKAAFRAHLERLATPDLVRVIVAHHEVIDDAPADVLRRVAATL